MDAESKKLKSREYQRQWREKNKGYHAAYQSRRKSKWLAENGPCRSCGSSENLEVDHVDPKSKLSHNIWSWSDVRRVAELKKCQVLCQRCHLAKTRNDIAKSNHLRSLRGERVLNSGLVRVIRACSGVGMSHDEIAAILGLNRVTVYSVVTGRSWSWLDSEGSA